MNAIVPQDLVQAVAQITGTGDLNAFYGVLQKTVMPNNATAEQTTAFLMVAKEYKLNPITKEIYAFPGKGGGIQPIVSIDGWLKIINSHPQFDGMEYVDDKDDNGNLLSVTCKIYRKDRSRAVEMTEYMSECRGTTEPWKRFPARMLRHKATIQAARYAFGFSGIVDEDEAQRIAPSPNDIQAQAEQDDEIELVTDEQIKEIRELLKKNGNKESGMCAYVGVKTINEMTIQQFKHMKKWVLKKIEEKQAEEAPVEAEFTEVANGEEIEI